MAVKRGVKQARIDGREYGSLAIAVIRIKESEAEIMVTKEQICNVVTKVSEKIWKTMSFKLQLGEGTGEVAITEWGLVQTIREVVGIKDSHFLTLKSDVPEASSGADIEWWITEYSKSKPPRIIGLSIQAKRLYKSSYDQLDHKVGESNTDQIPHYTCRKKKNDTLVLLL